MSFCYTLKENGNFTKFTIVIEIKMYRFCEFWFGVAVKKKKIRLKNSYLFIIEAKYKKNLYY